MPESSRDLPPRPRGRDPRRSAIRVERRRAGPATLLRRLVVLLGLILAGGGLLPVAAASLEVDQDGAALAGHSLRLTLTVSELPPGDEAEIEILVDGRRVETLRLGAGEHRVALDAARPRTGRHDVEVRAAGAVARLDLRVIPGWLSILPPLIAIGLAVLFRDVLVSLFLGVFAGALILHDWVPHTAFARSIDSFIAPALADSDHASILVFSALLGGMVGIISRSGGTRGIVERLLPYAVSQRRGQVATWLLGVLIFFDDYANTLIVGSTMRPITDRLRVSREKLAYIVDSTAAPVASVVPISTWIGFEVGLIAAAFTALDLPYNAYTTLVASIAYRFYPIFALILGFTIAMTGRDFGPMLKAERRAADTGELLAADAVPLADYDVPALQPPAEAPKRALNAMLPIATVVGLTLLGLYVSGSAAVERAAHGSAVAYVREVLAAADSLRVLLWASLGGVVVALVLALAQRILSLRQSIEAMIEGFKSMLLAFVVLILAWSIGAVCGELHTADFVVGLARGVLSPHWLPVLIFLLSALVSFATGTSWGTMAILMPLVIPIADGLSLHAGHPVGSESYYIFLVGTISSVLAGSVWGDHCSPISDTTILSSMASGCDHIAHVRTQMPYALAIGCLGMALGDIPTAYGLSPWISLGIGAVLIVVGVRLFGRTSGDDEAAAA